MHDLLQTSTSCHFKICLKSLTTGTTARRDPTATFLGTVLFDTCAEDGKTYKNYETNPIVSQFIMIDR